MKISIIIPTIGRTEKLEKVLQGISECTNFGIINPEILVIFDGKKTKEFLNFEAAFQCIKFYETRKKSGASKARNIGIDKSNSDIIAFIGDDTIPTKSWLQKIVDFHSKHPKSNIGLLGKISWTSELAKDSFHQWLENHAQFSFKKIKKQGTNWRNFYTSNISIKKSFIENERFSEEFSGWGFEDTEFGYRMQKKGLKLLFDKNYEVLHDHPQTLKKVLQNTKNARKNAKIFESLHPELIILPRGKKLFLLRMAIIFSAIPALFSQEIRWWRIWKKAWNKTITN